MRMPRLVWALALLLAVPVQAQTDYLEEEYNDDYPAQFLTGNPIFQSGDRLVGSISLHGPAFPSPTDYDLHYLTFAGAGSPGIYRYVFDLDAGGEDSFLVLFDQGLHTTLPFYLGINDDREPGSQFDSRIVFDHFDTTGANSVWGVDISAFDTLGEFDYALTVTREDTPVTDLGLLGRGVHEATGTNQPGAGEWYGFELDTPLDVIIDTEGSDLWDTELALFDANGNTIGGNDDIDPASGNLWSRIERHLDAGRYYVALGSYDQFGINYGSFYNWNLIFDRPLGWDRDGFSGDTFVAPYVVRVTAVPEPGAAALMLVGLAVGALALRRRRT